MRRSTSALGPSSSSPGLSKLHDRPHRAPDSGPAPRRGGRGYVIWIGDMKMWRCGWVRRRMRCSSEGGVGGSELNGERSSDSLKSTWTVNWCAQESSVRKRVPLQKVERWCMVHKVWDGMGRDGMDRTERARSRYHSWMRRKLSATSNVQLTHLSLSHTRLVYGFQPGVFVDGPGTSRLDGPVHECAYERKIDRLGLGEVHYGGRGVRRTWASVSTRRAGGRHGASSPRLA